MSDDLPPPQSRDEFTTAIICTLQAAYLVQASLDQEWPTGIVGKVEGDGNVYTIGRLGSHKVVVAWVSEIGKTAAAATAMDLRYSFTKAKQVFVVGICSGAPKAGGEEVLLGDVIISMEVKAMDEGRQSADRFVTPKGWQPDPEMRAFLSKLSSKPYRKRLMQLCSTYIEKLAERDHLHEAMYPGAQEDRLFESSYIHKHRGGWCTQCRTGYLTEACRKAENTSCADLKCEDRYLQPRSRLKNLLMADSGEANPMIHFGTVASGDMVIKSSEYRDSLAKDKVIGFEMESSGVIKVFSTVVVIKGVCDYADSHRNKIWQPYAAVAAAACLKAFLRLKEDELSVVRPALVPNSLIVNWKKILLNPNADSRSKDKLVISGGAPDVRMGTRIPLPLPDKPPPYTPPQNDLKTAQQLLQQLQIFTFQTLQPRSSNSGPKGLLPLAPPTQAFNSRAQVTPTRSPYGSASSETDIDQRSVNEVTTEATTPEEVPVLISAKVPEFLFQLRNSVNRYIGT